jgi:HEAT repeat protein
LRALGTHSTELLPEAAQALAGLAKDPSFEVRFLTLGPAAVLAPKEPAAGALLTQALGAPEQPWLRFRAVELVPRTPAFAAALLGALADPHVRVREAAARALGEARLASAAAPLVLRLQRDDWPLVRRSAAWALGALPRQAGGEAALTAALQEDGSPGVRGAAAESLGRRGAIAAVPELRDRFEDDEERFEVRARAATALGLLCDVPSSGGLSRWAQRLQDPLATSEERALGEAALGALASLAPLDLAQRVAPLAKGPHSKAAQRALITARTSPCSRARAR